MISPQEFKSKLINGDIKIKPKQKLAEFITTSDLIYEVLYKFSYQKLNKFWSIPELVYLFDKFYKQAEGDMDLDEESANIITSTAKRFI
jgi:hypothetical protein